METSTVVLIESFSLYMYLFLEVTYLLRTFFQIDLTYPSVRAPASTTSPIELTVAVNSIGEVVLTGARTDGYVKSIWKKVRRRYGKSEKGYAKFEKGYVKSAKGYVKSEKGFVKREKMLSTSADVSIRSYVSLCCLHWSETNWIDDLGVTWRARCRHRRPNFGGCRNYLQGRMLLKTVLERSGGFWSKVSIELNEAI